MVLITIIDSCAQLHPQANGNPCEQISFENIEPSESDTYPISVLNIDSLKKTIVVEKGVFIPMEDGISLSANVFRPKKEGRYPVVLSFTAYDKDKGPDEYSPVVNAAYLDDFNLGTYEVSPWTMWEGPDPAFWISNGYVVVQVDSRGFSKSEGTATLFDDQNIQDFHEAITWAGTQPWSNGNVGLNGVSYLAISQWVAATKNPPSYLKAIIPWEGNTDSFREVLYHGGIPETVFTEFWAKRINECANEEKPLPPFPVFKRIHKKPHLFQKISPPPTIYLNTIKVPALICATWSDQGLHSRGSFEGYKKISSENKWLYTHGRSKWATYYSKDALVFQKNFFDHFLKGIENGFDSIPSVRLEVRESLEKYKVRYEKSWPIESTKYRKLYLEASSNTLKAGSSSKTETIDYDPLTDNASFTYTFDKDTELSGNMKLKLWVSTSKGSDMDLFVAIKKLDTEGKEVSFYGKLGYTKGPVSMGWLRVSERELDTAKSTPWQPILTLQNPQKLSKNEILPVEIEILPSSTLFTKGESVQVVIQGKDLFCHPSLGHYYTVNKGIHTIHTGNKFDSHLLVPVIPD
ncbi:CocE/NonD family hydrolase [Aquimarina addita]|uniref:CocE/NonD family hydrolase n=2 Tax=Aquimarina addita TaxID=870485 RepID=A0ABP6UVV9_9FLAO